ncbi:MAG: polysaccharide biosynthesis tyrosine autokinase [Deltaproteobacteria bacterium]|nr:polysaccharide biosynthesis tyrosine autokinase [Deltaproteobacteria bacterium]
MNLNVERLSHHEVVRFLRKRGWIAATVAGLVTVTAAAVTLREPRVYQAEARVSLQPEAVSKMLPRQLVSFEAYYITNMKFDTEMEILRSKPMAERVTRAMGITPEADGEAVFADWVRRTMSSIEIRRHENTRIIRVIARDTSPDRAMRIANTYAEQYISRTIEEQIESFTRSHTWLKEQIIELEQRVQESELAVIDYIKEHGVDLVEIAAETQMPSQVQTGTVQGQFATGMEGDVLQSLRSQLIAREAEKTELSARYLPAHPRMRGLDEQIASLRSRIARQEEALKRSRKASREQAIEVREKAIQYDLLRRTADTNKALYNALIQKLKEIDITGNIAETDIRIVEKAERPVTPIRPTPRRTISLAALIGIALGILSALLIELMDPRIKSLDEFKDLFDVPILGTIPVISENDGDDPGSVLPAALVSRLRPASIPAEAYRTLRTNVKFSHSIESGRSLLLTSCSPREGKTTTAINLAVATALAGKRVLLIDADLRNPNIHRELGLNAKMGFTHYLAGDIDDYHEAVVPTWLEKLDIMTCGVITPNPSELLESGRLKELIAAAVSEYDQVIIDASPVLPVADAAILATAVQGVIMVFDASSINRGDVGRALDQIRKTGTKVYGVVMNRFTDLKHHQYYYYTYPASSRAQ